MLVKFNPIPKGRGGKGKPGDDEGTQPPDEPTPPPAQ